MRPSLSKQSFFGGGGCNSSKVLPLQPFAANSYNSILFRGNTSKFFSLQSIAAHSYVAILIRGNSSKVLPLRKLQPSLSKQFFFGGGGGVIPQKSCHCSPLQPTVTWHFQSGGNSSKAIPLKPFAANSYISILARSNSTKLLSLQSVAAHSYVAFLIRG